MSERKLSDVASFVLETVAENDGVWGCYHIDRVLGISGFSGTDAMDVLFDLTSRGLIEPTGDPKDVKSPYRVTDKGRELAARAGAK
ncbi:hypothetical protein [Haliangium sp.]|uniref:hypothetical protein n=1 Tax=Haliangium sp. TaxID=2663208 RepID=UPI003D0CCD0D